MQLAEQGCSVTRASLKYYETEVPLPWWIFYSHSCANSCVQHSAGSPLETFHWLWRETWLCRKGSKSLYLISKYSKKFWISVWCLFSFPVTYGRNYSVQLFGLALTLWTWLLLFTAASVWRNYVHILFADKNVVQQYHVFLPVWHNRQVLEGVVTMRVENHHLREGNWSLSESSKHIICPSASPPVSIEVMLVTKTRKTFSDSFVAVIVNHGMWHHWLLLVPRHWLTLLLLRQQKRVRISLFATCFCFSSGQRNLQLLTEL